MCGNIGSGDVSGVTYTTAKESRVRTQSGEIAELGNNPLVYTNSDMYLSSKARAAIDDWEKKRSKSKIEYAYMVDENGFEIAENRGGRSSVSTYLSDKLKSDTFTHIHPRGKGDEGYLGGTFSEQDIINFANAANTAKYPNSKLRSYRAKAAEGTYWIAKANNFDPNGLKDYVKQVFSEFEIAKAARKKEAGTLADTSWFKLKAKYTQIWNDEIVNVHNKLLAGQKKYGYTYGLERSI